MKILRKVLVLITILFCFSLGDCNDSTSTPDQWDVDDIFQDLIFDLEDLTDLLDIFGISSCDDLQDIIDFEVVGVIDCDDGGTSELVVTNFECDDGPPLTASFTLTQTDDDCREFGDTTDGVMVATMGYDGEDTVQYNVSSSSGFRVNDLTFVFNNLVVIIDDFYNSACSGTASVNNETCDATSDCSGCTLQ